MASCMICKQDVTSGYVLCPHCAESLKPTTLSPELAWFIDQLAEEILADRDIFSCAMCAMNMEDCKSQGGPVCRNGVKAWLLTRAQKFFDKVPKVGEAA